MRSTLLVYCAALCLLVGSASIAPPLDEVRSPPERSGPALLERPREPGAAFLLAHATAQRPNSQHKCDLSCCVAPCALLRTPKPETLVSGCRCRGCACEP